LGITRETKAQEYNDILMKDEEEVSEEQNEDMEGNYLTFIKNNFNK
jgi:hypothetical protein